LLWEEKSCMEFEEYPSVDILASYILCISLCSYSKVETWVTDIGF
jgi:hypothetical protein